jgi:hypothetical protein
MVHSISVHLRSSNSVIEPDICRFAEKIPQLNPREPRGRPLVESHRWRSAPLPVRRCCALGQLSLVRPGGGRRGLLGGAYAYSSFSDLACHRRGRVRDAVESTPQPAPSSPPLSMGRGSTAASPRSSVCPRPGRRRVPSPLSALATAGKSARCRSARMEAAGRPPNSNHSKRTACRLRERARSSTVGLLRRHSHFFDIRGSPRTIGVVWLGYAPDAAEFI